MNKKDILIIVLLAVLVLTAFCGVFTIESLATELKQQEENYEELRSRVDQLYSDYYADRICYPEDYGQISEE